MAFGVVTNGETSSFSTTANQASCTVTIFANIPVNSFVVAACSADNHQTTDGDEGMVSSVTDSRSNTWTKVVEFCNGQGAAQAGATISLWQSQLTTQLNAADVITFNLTNSTSRDRTCCHYKAFSVGAGSTVSVEGTPGTLANDGADPGSLDVTTANIECLRVRCTSAETNSTTPLTATDGTWTALPWHRTASGGSAANISIGGEWKISTATGSASNPSWVAADCASVYAAFKEVVGGRVPKTPSFQPFLAQ